MVITQKMNVVNTKHVHLKLIKMASFTAYQKKKKKKAQAWWFTSVIPATLRVEIKSTEIQSQHRQKKLVRPHLNQ
jgi:hypothetical protein